MQPDPGEIVRVRSRQYLVEGVDPPPSPDEATLVRLSCLEDDAQGEALEVLWEHEVDARLLRDANWGRVASRGFDEAHLFSAYLHTLRWNCVTSTDPRLFQAPYRAGIEVKAYQLEPLRMALGMPRANVFIADDVGLGKTIEAGLILRELLIRQKVRKCVVCAPPSVVTQWREEMEERFGLSFVVYDREYASRVRTERGWAVNPWTTHTRFIISQALIRDEAYASSLRDWLGEFDSGAMLILDEAHNVAPASGARYAIDSKLTRAMRDLAPRFEHKLFLSATPHNGHSNSFSALLEILDPQRFCRGVPVDAKLRDEVMVRRLKSDLRAEGEPFPKRNIECVEITGLPEDAPALVLSRLLRDYRVAREARLAAATRSKRASAMLVVTSLQKRLLSSIDAFARTLEVHRRSMEKQAEAALELDERQLDLLRESPGADDERATLDEEEVDKEADAQMAAATRQSADGGAELGPEQDLLARMTEVARRSRYDADARVTHLIDWIRRNQCPDLGQEGARWLPRRVLIFTEYADTKRYLERQLANAIQGSDQAADRIATFHGGIGDERREEIKAAFNADPEHDPLRILIATDAAREGVNLQNHCYDLFHFDVPWNPGRLEQRNGRIDRKLQKAEQVNCYYFVLPQRAEDRVLKVLVEKTERIHEQLGSLSPVIERRMDRLLDKGIEHDEVEDIATALDMVDQEDGETGPKVRTMTVEMGSAEAKQRRARLQKQLEVLRGLLGRSKAWIGLDDLHFRDALSASLEAQGAEGLQPVDPAKAVEDPERARWLLPDIDARKGADPSWAATLDSLRTPRPRHTSLAEWRREAPIRPVVFHDPGNLDGEVVHLHLEQRVVHRLLGRFLSMGFRDDDLRRACVLRTDETGPQVVLLGRLSLFGAGGARLHDKVLAVAAPWAPPDERKRGGLRPVGEGDKDDVMRLVETSLGDPRLREVERALQDRLKAHADQDVQELHPHLEKRAKVLTERAERDLRRRANNEAGEMTTILEAQKKRIRDEQRKHEGPGAQLSLTLDKDEKRQLDLDRRHWGARLAAIDQELKSEPERVRQSYEVKATRVEPVGLVYLWPVSS